MSLPSTNSCSVRLQWASFFHPPPLVLATLQTRPPVPSCWSEVVHAAPRVVHASQSFQFSSESLMLATNMPSGDIATMDVQGLLEIKDTHRP